LRADIGEIEARDLHLKAGYKSLHAFCMAEYALSDDEALLRINVSRVAREFPAIFCAIAEGKLSMTTVLVLKPLLTSATANELLAAAAGKTKSEVRVLMADRQPRSMFPRVFRRCRLETMSTSLQVLSSRNDKTSRDRGSNHSHRRSSALSSP